MPMVVPLVSRVWVSRRSVSMSARNCWRSRHGELRATGQYTGEVFKQIHFIKRAQQLGLARTKKERSQKHQNFSQVPTWTLLGARRADEAYERIRRAIATIMEHNRGSSDPNGRWYITQTLLRELTGAHPRFIRLVLDANADLIKAHHQELGILAAQNRTPAPKPEPISKALSIAEHPTDFSCLEEIALPALSASEAVD